MTSWANNFNGIASGTAPTSGNSGGVSGTAFTIVAAPTSGTMTADSAAAFEGATGLRLVYPETAAGNGYVAWSISGGTVGVRISGSFWFRFSALPAALSSIATAAGASTVRLTASGQIGIYDTSNVQKAASTAVTAGTWVYVQWATTAGTTTANGRLELRVTTTTGTQLVNYDSGATQNTNTATIATIYHGRTISSTAAFTADYDLLNIDNTLTGGTFPGTAAPTPVGGNIKVYSGTGFVVKPVKVWTGTAWVAKPLKRWNGTAWVPTNF